MWKLNNNKGGRNNLNIYQVNPAMYQPIHRSENAYFY